MTVDAIRDEVAALQAEFRRLGFYRPASVRIMLQWVYNLALALGGLAGWCLFTSWWLDGLALLISTLGLSGMSTLAHTAAHGAALPWRWANTLLAYLGFPFMLMVSINYWRFKHNGVHHPNPNIIGIDKDCDLMPFFAMNEADVLSAHGARRFYYRHVQGWVFPLAITLNVFNMQRSSWAYLIARLANGRIRQPADWLDLTSLLAHIGIWIVLPSLLLSPGQGMLLYFMRIGLLGHFAFFVLAPAHFPAEADLVETAPDQDFVMRQLQGTLNFRTGLVGRLACNGLEYQIEHHLFPNICHVYYARVAPLVREFCNRNGYPYRCLGWGEAIVKSYAAIFRPRPVCRHASRYQSLPAAVADPIQAADHDRFKILGYPTSPAAVD
jgi:fatty acid desaturase